MELAVCSIYIQSVIFLFDKMDELYFVYGMTVKRMTLCKKS